MGLLAQSAATSTQPAQAGKGKPSLQQILQLIQQRPQQQIMPPQRQPVGVPHRPLPQMPWQQPPRNMQPMPPAMPMPRHNLAALQPALNNMPGFAPRAQPTGQPKPGTAAGGQQVAGVNGYNPYLDPKYASGYIPPEVLGPWWQSMVQGMGLQGGPGVGGGAGGIGPGDNDGPDGGGAPW